MVRSYASSVELGLRDRVALVSGASSGLGLAVARELAAEGAHVAICARERERLQRAAAQLQGCGPGRVHAAPVDLRDEAAVRGWVDHVARELGGLHVVVSNAGGPPGGPLVERRLDDYRSALETSLLSHVGLVTAALPHLRAARLLAYEALWLKDAGQPHSVPANMVKWWAPRLAADAAHQALLTFGQHAWSNDSPQGQRMRDVMGLEIGDGTAQVTKLVLARALLGREAAP